MGAWVTPNVDSLILSSTDLRRSGKSFVIRNVSFHESTDLAAAITVGPTLSLDLYEQVFAYVPGPIERSLAGVTSTTTTMTFYLNKAMPDEEDSSLGKRIIQGIVDRVGLTLAQIDWRYTQIIESEGTPFQVRTGNPATKRINAVPRDTLRP
jgi:hypothetical protein